MGKKILRIHLPPAAGFLMVREVQGATRSSPWGEAMYGMTKRLWQRVRAAACQCSGATVVEYAVVLALIVVVCIGTLQVIGMWNSPVFAMINDRVKV
jgi:Flp pilus assembly pilin Flp